MFRIRCPALPALLLSGILLLSGCGSTSPEALQEDTAASLRGLGQAYGQFTLAMGRPPQSEREFRAYLTKVKPGAAEALLKSPRDGQPFVIVWGFDVRRQGAGAEGGNKQTAEAAGAIYIYERQGSAGQRFVLFTHGGVQLLTEAELRAARFVGSHQPQ